MFALASKMKSLHCSTNYFCHIQPSWNFDVVFFVPFTRYDKSHAHPTNHGPMYERRCAGSICFYIFL